MSEVIIAEWGRNARETLRIRLDTYKGKAIVDCRSWYQDGDGILKPGRSGLTVAIRHLPQLADALGKAVEVATASGLITGDAIQGS